MNNTTPPLENTQANPPLGEFFTDPKIGNFLQEIAIKYGLHISKHKSLYELPRGVMLHRFKGDKIVKLIGQYHNEDDHQKPKRVYTIEVSKGDGTHLVYIQEDDKCLMSITYNGSICDAEYVGIKALKAVLRSRDKRNQRCHNQDKKRKAAKAQEETI